MKASGGFAPFFLPPAALQLNPPSFAGPVHRECRHIFRARNPRAFSSAPPRAGPSAMGDGTEAISRVCRSIYPPHPFKGRGDKRIETLVRSMEFEQLKV